MESPHFDRLTRTLADASSRRGLLRGLVAGLGMAAIPLPGWVAAKNGKRSKSRKKKPAFNQFGCLNVGQKCGGKSANCCSGICQGKKPKKGEKDKSRCVAHDEGGCRADQDFFLDPLTSICPANAVGFCFRTTGSASFCGQSGGLVEAACAQDADCRALGFGEGAACVVCPGCAEGTACSQRDS